MHYVYVLQYKVGEDYLELMGDALSTTVETSTENVLGVAAGSKTMDGGMGELGGMTWHAQSGTLN